DKEVPNSTVIITNPTHFAVALKYEKGASPVPRVVAKGVDALSKRIRDLANKNKSLIVANLLLARALYREVKPGQEIPRTFYHSVDKIIATNYRLDEEKRKMRQGYYNQPGGQAPLS
ncbi:hypothetical protein BVY03_01200, partial [bacterium K02(2017)]